MVCMVTIIVITMLSIIKRIISIVKLVLQFSGVYIGMGSHQSSMTSFCSCFSYM